MKSCAAQVLIPNGLGGERHNSFIFVFLAYFSKAKEFVNKVVDSAQSI